MSTSNPLTRDQIERKRDSKQPDCVPECMCWPETLIDDLAATCLELTKENNETRNKAEYIAGQYRSEFVRADTAEARARVLADERDKAVDRAAALEEGLRDALHELTTLNGLVATDTPNAYGDALSNGCDANGAWDVFAANLFTIDTLKSIDLVTALLTERGSPKIEAIATHVDNPEKGGRTERDDLGKGVAPDQKCQRCDGTGEMVVTQGFGSEMCRSCQGEGTTERDDLGRVTPE